MLLTPSQGREIAGFGGYRDSIEGVSLQRREEMSPGQIGGRRSSRMDDQVICCLDGTEEGRKRHKVTTLVTAMRLRLVINDRGP